MPLPRLSPGRLAPRPARATVAAAATAALLPLTATAAPAAESHEVGPGETLSEIAQIHGVGTAALAGANGLADPDLIYSGRTLTVPTGSGSAGAAGSGANGGAHTVSKGETLSGIALGYGVTVRALAAANGLSAPYGIFPGERLALPDAAGQAVSEPAAESVLHRVEAGQTLSEISARYGVTTTAIATRNGITGRDLLQIGQELQIPAVAEPAPDAPDRATVEDLLDRYAKDFDLDPALVKAIAWQESGWNNDVVSSAGAVGIMQVLPGTNAEVAQVQAGRTLDLDEPADNILAGMHYLQLLVELTDGSTEELLAGYYQGLRSVSENGRYPSTEQYIDNVLALRERFAD